MPTWSRLFSRAAAETLHHLATMTSCKQPRSCRPSDLLAFGVLRAGAEGGGSAFVGLTTASTLWTLEESGRLAPRLLPSPIGHLTTDFISSSGNMQPTRSRRNIFVTSRLNIGFLSTFVR